LSYSNINTSNINTIGSGLTGNSSFGI